MKAGLALLMAAALTACSVKKQVQPAAVTEPRLCVERNFEVNRAFLPVLLDSLRAHGYEPVTVAPGEDAPCPAVLRYAAGYDARNGAHLTSAELRVFRAEVAAGSARYEIRGFNAGPPVTTRGKLDALIGEMLPRRAPRVVIKDVSGGD